MHTASVEGFEIEYDVEVSSQPGFELETMNVVKMDIGFRGQSTLIKPKSEIEITAIGTIQHSRGAGGVLKLGFVQSLTNSERRADYKTFFYWEGHGEYPGQYPVKDGEGKPWYKDGKDNLLYVRPGKDRDKKTAVTLFKIKVTDEPHFDCPPKIKGEELQGVKFHDSFKTCLLAEFYNLEGDAKGVPPGQKPYKQAFLHEVIWEFKAEGPYANGQFKAKEGSGYRYGEGSLGLVLPSPYSAREGIKLDGPSANRTVKCQLRRKTS